MTAQQRPTRFYRAMKRTARIALGILLIAVMFAWSILRHHEPLNGWVTGSALVRWALQGGAWASLLGGVALIAPAFWRGDRGREESAD